jgi:hypothetical protein
MNLMMVRGQVITINPASQNLEMDASTTGDALAQIQNNSSTARTVKWIRYEDAAPAPWYSSVCDNINCYDSTKTFNIVTIGANSQGLLSLNVYPVGVAGNGSYHLIAFDVNDSANANATEVVSVVVNPTGITNVSEESFSIYPNPAKDVLYMHIDMSKHVTSIDIHNIVGEKIKSVNLQSGLKSVTIPVADLKKGIYFLRVLSNGKEVATLTFSKD